MHRVSRKHNWKARQRVETTIDPSEEKKLKVEIGGLRLQGYDDCNLLVLPSKKRKTKVTVQGGPVQKLLSKKQRKHLEKILDQKRKKLKRAELLESLKDHQASPQEMSLFTSTSQMQTRVHNKRSLLPTEPTGTQDNVSAVGVGRGKRRRKGKPSVEAPPEDDTSSSESSDDDEDMSDGDIDVSQEKMEISGEDSGQAGDVIEESNRTSQRGDLQEQSGEKKPDKEGGVKDVSPPEKQAEKKPNREGASKKAAVYISLERLPDIQEQRLRLPILSEEQIIMEAVRENPVVIVCGETGSGKTTQVPQFLYEAGYAQSAMIAVTEPRRVAAISMSQRVAMEMNLSSRLVSYQIRYEGNVTEDTRIKFLTDGVLLKEVQKDFLLTKYSVVIIDEAHERSVYTDILIGLLSRIVPLRHQKGNPLKLIIMSATLRLRDFTENTQLFKVTPPIVKVESRQHPVTIHFNRRTPSDYLAEALRKVCKIHRQLPEGGILVFVTGQQEVHSMCCKLRALFPRPKSTGDTIGSKPDDDKEHAETSQLPKISLDNYSVLPLDEEAELQPTEDDIDTWDDTEGDTSLKPSEGQTEQPMYVLPLYSLLAPSGQAQVFKPPPDGCRLCIVATNVAETSLTIPNIKYVVDTGKVKTKFYDKVTGVSTFRVTNTSQASANQRAGRAGRTGPGHCYRLYSSAVFNDDFVEFAVPEIMRRPVDDLILQMKDMGIDKIVNFPFPTAPDNDALQAAEKLLLLLGALDKITPAKTAKRTKKVKYSTQITPLGRTIACFPVSPRYGKMLSLAHQHSLLPYVVALVAALSVQELFVEVNRPAEGEDEKEDQKQRRLGLARQKLTWAGSGNSQLLGDLMVLLKAVGACEYVGCTPAFCEKYNIRHKAVLEIRKLRTHLTNSVNTVISDVNLAVDPHMAPPSEQQAKCLRQIVLAGFGDHVARKLDNPPSEGDPKMLKHAYQALTLEDPVYIHPGSVLYKQKPQYVVYQYIDETSHMYMKGVSVAEPDWLPLFVPSFCSFSKPLDKPPPCYSDKGHIICHMTSTFGPHFWDMPPVELEYPAGLDRYKWFAKCLLEGTVFTKLLKFVPVLLSAPVTMVKPWANLQPRTVSLLKALVVEEIDSKQRLTQTWRDQPSYLLDEYCEWIPEAKHKQLKTVWPPCVDSNTGLFDRQSGVLPPSHRAPNHRAPNHHASNHRAPNHWATAPQATGPLATVPQATRPQTTVPQATGPKPPHPSHRVPGYKPPGPKPQCLKLPGPKLPRPKPPGPKLPRPKPPCPKPLGHKPPGHKPPGHKTPGPKRPHPKPPGPKPPGSKLPRPKPPDPKPPRHKPPGPTSCGSKTTLLL
ncbi:putative ATP-dependent RNA helicase DHX37 [Lamellibrachia satsuma]|nr:putative ATP-dependent RNA helicase DHX37 [Lamellibrachia satsuma]